jgi:twitching motility protein PilT
MGAAIDAILGIMVRQGANELRVGTGRAPRILRDGAPKRLTMRETSDVELRHLIGGLLSPERESGLREGRRVEFVYDAPALGSFHVVFDPRTAEEGFDALFVQVPARGLSAHEAPDPEETPAQQETHRADHTPPPDAHVGVPSTRDAGSGRAQDAAAPRRELVNLLVRAASMRASDLHVCSGEPAHVRVEGRLRLLDPESVPDTEELLDGCLDPAARAQLASGASAELIFDLPEVGRFRVNVYRTANRLAAAIRLLPPTAPTLDSLRLPVPLDDVVGLPQGLVILCGPTGSGKTTTLAALANEALRRRSVVVLTLEDPIEYRLAPPPESGAIVRQRQIGLDVRDFATGLRDALREDPDVLVIGEMRDTESISLALTAAETGHLVFTSLHCGSAASAVERIADAYPPERQAQVRVQLADVLRIVVAQRLLPRARGAGRVLAVEVLRGTHAVGSAIREGKTPQIQGIIQSSRREGMLPLERCLADMVRDAVITVDAARAVANEPGSLESYLGKPAG